MEAARDEDAETPPLLSKYWQCKNWGVLPRSGGMDDQDYREMYLMPWLHRAYDAARAWETSTKKKPRTDAQKKMLLWMIKAGIA